VHRFLKTIYNKLYICTNIQQTVYTQNKNYIQQFIMHEYTTVYMHEYTTIYYARIYNSLYATVYMQQLCNSFMQQFICNSFICNSLYATVYYARIYNSLYARIYNSLLCTNIQQFICTINCSQIFKNCIYTK
jgi:hypothetical protein